LTNEQTILEFFYGDVETTINNAILDDIDYVVPKNRILSYVNKLLAIPYSEYLYSLISWELTKIESGDLTQSSCFSAAEIEMCQALLSFDNLGFTFEEIGQLFPQYCKKNSLYALRKYGENQVKTSKQLGLTYQYYGKWYLNCLGYIYEDLSEENRRLLLARTILRDSLYGSMMRDLIFNDIALEDYLIGLSKSTIARRATGILRILGLGIEAAERENIPLHKCYYTKPQSERSVVIKNAKEKIYLFDKKIDKSFVSRGFTLKKKIHPVIPTIIGFHLDRGDSYDVSINIANKTFSASLNHIGFSDSDRDCFQIYWKQKSGIVQYLEEYISTLNNSASVGIYAIIGEKTFEIRPSTNNESEVD
jgi:hypothetical protein